MGHTDGSLHGNTSSGDYDVFLSKFDTNGLRKWTSQIGSTDNDYPVGATMIY